MDLLKMRKKLKRLLQSMVLVDCQPREQLRILRNKRRSDQVIRQVSEFHRQNPDLSNF